MKTSVKVLAIAALFGVLTTAAHAQSIGTNMLSGTKTIKTQEEVDAQKARDDAYNTAINKVPSQKGATDPWGNVRGATAAPSKQTGARQGAGSNPK